MFLKSACLTSVILLSYLVFFGQTNFPYEKEWKLIDSLITIKNLPKSALVELDKVYAAAKKEKNEAQGAVLEALSSNNVLKPGSKLVMRIIVKTDRDLEYVHLNDKRAACLEPANVLSGYQWQDGLDYYQSTKDESTSFFFDRLPKGTHVFEYPVFVTTAGTYSNGISTLECKYAPEFAARSEGLRIHIESN